MTRMTLHEAFHLNPKVSLSKGTVAPFVDMATLRPFTRDVRATVKKTYSGGTKFLNGDVLMARITPSLENGKTSIYRAAPGFTGPAFGSTEFIVIRGREGVSDSLFAYYIFTSDKVREYAISSMNGSSGRQRVQPDSLATFQFDLPPLDKQRAIAATLGALDDKIESNRRACDLLWSLIWASWEMLTGEASVRPLGDVLELVYGKSLPAVKRTHGSVPVYGSNGITGWHNDPLVAGPVVVVGRKGSIGEVHWSHVSAFPIDTTFYVRSRDDYPLVACYLALRKAGLQSMNSDSAIPGLNRERALQVGVPLPVLREATAWARNANLLVTQVEAIEEQTVTLETLRNDLLPELISGRIHVPTAAEVMS